MKLRSVALILTLAALTAACSRTNVTVPPDQSTTGMAVVGVGGVEVRPDTLVVGLGVESTAPTAPEALDAMTTAANRMIDAIREAGVEPENIQTVSLSVREARPQPGVTQPVPVEGVAPEDLSIQGSPAGLGFVGEQRLRVRILDLERGGEVIEAAVAAAGPDARVFNMSLDVDDPDAAIAEARGKAMEDALARADQLAESAGVELGAPISIEEIDAPRPDFDLALDLPAPEADAGFGGASATAGIAADIEPGVRSLEVRILVRFAIDE